LLTNRQPKLASKTPVSQAGCVASFALAEVSALLRGHSIVYKE